MAQQASRLGDHRPQVAIQKLGSSEHQAEEGMHLTSRREGKDTWFGTAAIVL